MFLTVCRISYYINSRFAARLSNIALWYFTTIVCMREGRHAVYWPLIGWCDSRAGAPAYTSYHSPSIITVPAYSYNGLKANGYSLHMTFPMGWCLYLSWKCASDAHLQLKYKHHPTPSTHLDRPVILSWKVTILMLNMRTPFFKLLYQIYWDFSYK